MQSEIYPHVKVMPGAIAFQGQGDLENIFALCMNVNTFLGQLVILLFPFGF